jgi:hypothetical protein
LQEKRKASEKLEKLNQAKEQIEAIQREIDEMKEQENSSLWQESPLHNSGPNKRTPKENFFAGIGISQFVESVGHTPRVLMQGRKNCRRRTPGRIPLYSY